MPSPSPTPSETDRHALGRLHPSLQGRRVPARPAGKDRILYRVVDEYGVDALTAQRTRSLKRPLKEVFEGNGLDRDGA